MKVYSTKRVRDEDEIEEIRDNGVPNTDVIEIHSPKGDILRYMFEDIEEVEDYYTSGTDSEWDEVSRKLENDEPLTQEQWERLRKELTEECELVDHDDPIAPSVYEQDLYTLAHQLLAVIEGEYGGTDEHLGLRASSRKKLNEVAKALKVKSE